MLPAVARNDEKGLRHSMAGGNPGAFELDYRLRGSDNPFLTYLQDTVTQVASKSPRRFDLLLSVFTIIE